MDLDGLQSVTTGVVRIDDQELNRGWRLKSRRLVLNVARNLGGSVTTLWEELRSYRLREMNNSMSPLHALLREQQALIEKFDQSMH